LSPTSDREKLTDAEQPVFTKWRNDETERMQNALKEKYPESFR
jgi:hypothetical protein